MSEQEPINVRVARALGWTITERYEVGGIWIGIPPQPYGVDLSKLPRWVRPKLKRRVPDYVHDDAFCWRILRYNRADVIWLPSGMSVSAPCFLRGAYSQEPNVAALEWFCAAVAAGVDVVVP